MSDPADTDDVLLARLLAEEGAAAAPGRTVPRLPEGADAPLAFAQRRLWFLERLRPGGAAYNISAAFILRGPFESARFARSLAWVAGRHDTLRSVFRAGEDGEPYQRALPMADGLFEIAYGEVPPDADPAAWARAVAAEEAARPFDLETGPPARVRVVRLDADTHAVVCTLHHVVSDGWSTGVLIREIGVAYAALGAGREPRLPALPVRYADYAAWQRSPEAVAAAERSVAWWRERLRDLPGLDLPTDFARPAVQTFRGGRVGIAIGSAERDALLGLARREGATLFAVVLAAFQAALAAWSGQLDFAVGAPVNVNGATIGLLSGTQLYVAGNGTPTGPLCASIPSAAATAATYCGTLDIVNLTTMTDPYYNNPGAEIAITDGYHNRIDLTTTSQLFVGAYHCTNVGNSGNPVGEVRGCLAIYNGTNNSVVFPPYNGDVTGLQGFTTRTVEYVAQQGTLLVYDTLTDTLLFDDYLPEGTINIVGYVGDVKAIDFF